LELAEPTIEQAIQKLVEADVGQVFVMPLLLFAAGHARRDIPAAVAAALPPGCRTVFAEPLGCETEILELSHRRLQQARRVGAAVNRGDQAGSDTCLLLVGRGSSDESATAAMHEFARLRQDRAGIASEVAFLAKARPLLADHLPRIAARGYRRVIVQPHLLFAGELAASVERQVAEISAQYSRTEWLLAPLLADSVGERGIGTQLLAHLVAQRWESRSRLPGGTAGSAT
jgi:sirohydrochlorin cobaltochelatase